MALPKCNIYTTHQIDKKIKKIKQNNHKPYNARQGDQDVAFHIYKNTKSEDEHTRQRPDEISALEQFVD